MNPERALSDAEMLTCMREARLYHTGVVPGATLFYSTLNPQRMLVWRTRENVLAFTVGSTYHQCRPTLRLIIDYLMLGLAPSERTA